MPRPTTHEVLSRIASLSANTSPTLVSIGVTRDHFVHNDVVVVREACPKVVKALVTEFEFVDLTEHGLEINTATTP